MPIEYQASRDTLYQSGLHPPGFIVPPATLSLDAFCAELSRLAYLKFENAGAQLDALDAALRSAGLLKWQGFSNWETGTQAFGAYDAINETLYVAFRGTEPDQVVDIGSDLDAASHSLDGGALVHSGFYKAFCSVEVSIKTWIDGCPFKRLILTGHSLGAALSTVAATIWPAARLVTFGSPRVGNEKFIQTIKAEIARYVDCSDAVTQVPPSVPGLYCHAGREIYIDRFGHIQAGLSDLGVREDQLEGLGDYVKDYAWRSGTVIARNLADHAPLNYLRALLI